MKVSVALCTYNGEKFLSEQLESLLNQTRLPDEVIICDDCSIDETAAIINKFSDKTPFPVRLTINESKLGSTKNFEKAISLTTGDLIFLSDQDDVWLPEKIELIENQFKKSLNTGLVFTNAQIVNDELEPLGDYLWDYFLDDVTKQKFIEGKELEVLQYGGVVTGATMAFRAELKALILPIPLIEKFIHDSWIALISSICFKIIPLDIPLVKYRQHGNQQLGVKDYKVTPPLQNRPEGYSRYKAYDDSVQRQLIIKYRTESIRQACEIVLKNNFSPKSELKIVANPVLSLLRIEESTAEAIGHFEVRRDMPKRHLKRLSKIIPELINGNYHRFSKGLKSAILDLIERIQ